LENPTTLVAAVTPKERYSQLAYQSACGGGYAATGPHDPAPENQRFFLWWRATKQRPALHAQCLKPLVISSPVTPQKLVPTPHISPLSSAFEKRLNGCVAYDSIRLRKAR
jgi:hypothetical protein